MGDRSKSVTGISEREANGRAASDKGQTYVNFTAPILVAVDLSGNSRAVLLWACEHAVNAGAPLMVLHVVHDRAEAPGTYSRNSPDPLMPMADTAERMLFEFMTEMRADRPDLRYLAEARTRVVSGLPASTIVDEAVRLDATLIVMGSRGPKGLSGLLYGSTAKKVVQISPIPVTVVKSQSG